VALHRNGIGSHGYNVITVVKPVNKNVYVELNKTLAKIGQNKNAVICYS
jgi:hypothetical protein